MSKNTSSTNPSVAAATASSAAKRVSKKSDGAAAPAAAAAAQPAQAAAASPAAAPAKKVASKQAAQAAPVAAQPAAQAAPAAIAEAPVASSSEAVTEQADVRSVEQEINDLIKVQQQLRDASVAAIKNLQKLQKRVSKEIKEAGRRRRRVKKEEDGQVKEKRPTIFTTPVTLKDELCAFLGKPKGSQMTPADVTRAFSAYVEQHKLKDTVKGHTIHPDAAMRKVLNLNEGEEVGYRQVQKHLYKLYVLPEKKAVSKQ
jgi:chromatin remodeling complex protein RSC6